MANIGGTRNNYQEEQMKRKLVILGLILTLVASSFMAACAKPAPAPAPAPEPIVLSMVGVTKAVVDYYSYHALMEQVAERSGGELIIESKGGPEAIPTKDQFEAVRSGVVDIQASYSSYHASAVPVVSRLKEVAELSPEGYLPPKLFDFMVERYKTVNIRFLGQAQMYCPLTVMVNEKWSWVKKPADLAGLKARSGGAFHIAFAKKVGIVPVAMPTGDAYTALDRGLVEGCTFMTNAYKFALDEVLDYLIMPPYKTSANGIFVMNLDTWNSLSPHLQDLVLEVVHDIVPDQYAWDKDDYLEGLQILQDRGMEIIEFTGSDAEYWQSLYPLLIWEKVGEAVGPEEVSKMKELVKQ